MDYLLDTDICIYILRNKPAEVLKRFIQLKPEQLFISSISVSELYYGVENSQNHKQNTLALKKFLQTPTIVDFNEAAAIEAARIRHQLKTRGTPIGAYDVQIAAIAIARHFTLITNNTREFKRIRNLKVLHLKVVRKLLRRRRKKLHHAYRV